jgi:SAM-dependent methyltransferase
VLLEANIFLDLSRHRWRDNLNGKVLLIGVFNMTDLIVNALEKVRGHGVGGTVRRIRAHILPRRSKLQRYATLFSGHGLEIGGPSDNFRPTGFVSVYTVANRIDNINFASQTTWENSIVAGNTFRFDKRKEPGKQFICEATDLSIIPSSSYDFLLSSHTLEHTANPILALKEWMRVVKNGGHLLVALPDKEKCFDHRRPVTTSRSPPGTSSENKISRAFGFTRAERSIEPFAEKAEVVPEAERCSTAIHRSFCETIDFAAHFMMMP